MASLQAVRNACMQQVSSYGATIAATYNLGDINEAVLASLTDDDKWRRIGARAVLHYGHALVLVRETLEPPFDPGPISNVNDFAANLATQFDPITPLSELLAPVAT